MSEDSFQQWLETRPECVQKLAKEFPIGTRIMQGDTLWYLLGYTEDDGLILTPIDPWKDYDKAVEQKKIAHAQCVRDNFEKSSIS